MEAALPLLKPTAAFNTSITAEEKPFTTSQFELHNPPASRFVVALPLSYNAYQYNANNGTSYVLHLPRAIRRRDNRGIRLTQSDTNAPRNHPCSVKKFANVEVFFNVWTCNLFCYVWIWYQTTLTCLLNCHMRTRTVGKTLTMHKAS